MRSSTISALLFAAVAVAAPAPAPASAPAQNEPRSRHHASKHHHEVSKQHGGEHAAAEPEKSDISIDSVLPPVVKVNTRGSDEDLIAQLLSVATQRQRANILNQPGDYVFDFNDVDVPGAKSEGLGGFSTSATARTFPALIGNGAAMTVGFLGPCGMNTAHVHPRATELNIVVKGRLVTNFIIENGVDLIANTMSLYQMSVFPRGAIHQEYNPDCEDTVFVAGFDNEDPGVEQVAQAFFALNPDVITATLGGVTTLNGKDLESFRDFIPDNVALGIEACLKKCNIQKNAKRDDFFVKKF